MASQPQPDTQLAARTVKWLGQQLRTHQFISVAQRKKLNGLQRDHRATQATIRSLTRRIQRELDKNPTLYRDLGLDQ